MDATLTNPTSVAMLVGMPVTNAQGRVIGRVNELAVDVGVDSTRVSGLLVSPRIGGKSHRAMIPVKNLKPPKPTDKKLQTVSEPEREQPCSAGVVPADSRLN